MDAAKNKVIDYYDGSFGEAQRFWSRNLHFGYYVAGEHLADNERMLRNMTARTLELLQLPEDAPVRLADLGCGLGAPATQALETFPHSTLIGVNISPGQIEQSERLMPEPLRHRVRFVRSDFQNTGLDAASFDGVYAIESACYAQGSGKQRLLAEMYRLLKPGGRFAIADGCVRKSPPTRGLFASLYNRLCGKWALKEMANITELTSAAHRVGFERVSVRDVSWNTLPSLGHVPRAAWRNLRHHGGDWTRAQLDNLEAPVLQLLVSVYPQYMGYFLATGQKPSAVPDKRLPPKRRYLGPSLERSAASALIRRRART